MNSTNVGVRSVDPIRVARLSAVAPSSDYADIGPITQQLFGDLMGSIQRDGLAVAGPTMATYEPGPDGAVSVSACCPVGPDTRGGDAYDVIELPGIAQVATYQHAGSMATIGETYQTLAAWIETEGHRTDGRAREVYLVSHPEPESNWRTEVQLPVRRS